VVSWVAEPGSNWALPLDWERIPSDQTAIHLAAAPIMRLNAARRVGDTLLWIYAWDGAYGNVKFWQELPPGERYGVVTRLCRDRGLYQAPTQRRGRRASTSRASPVATSPPGGCRRKNRSAPTRGGAR
jgi:hypothetical protein